jgi:hypothetical protein
MGVYLESPGLPTLPRLKSGIEGTHSLLSEVTTLDLRRTIRFDISTSLHLRDR